MSRRRTGTRYVPITISLKPSMVDDIEATLGPKQSRSQWVADAIAKKMNDDDYIVLERTSIHRLLSEIRTRKETTDDQRAIIELWLSKI